jgi:hypothetical protein
LHGTGKASIFDFMFSLRSHVYPLLAASFLLCGLLLRVRAR